MRKWKEINSLRCKQECSYMLFNGKMYRGADMLTCLNGAMQQNGASLMDRYGIDPVVDLMDACDILDVVISTEGNGIIGIDVLRYDNESYFAIYFKKDVLCCWPLLDAFAKAGGHKIAYFMYDTGDCFVVPEPEGIVIETIELKRIEK